VIIIKRKDKILMAIWMMNRLIDKYPEIYKAWKKIYQDNINNKRGEL